VALISQNLSRNKHYSEKVVKKQGKEKKKFGKSALMAYSCSAVSKRFFRFRDGNYPAEDTSTLDGTTDPQEKQRKHKVAQQKPVYER
jgi:hypothetical protein